MNRSSDEAPVGADVCVSGANAEQSRRPRFLPHAGGSLRRSDFGTQGMALGHARPQTRPNLVSFMNRSG